VRKSVPARAPCFFDSRRPAIRPQQYANAQRLAGTASPRSSHALSIVYDCRPATLSTFNETFSTTDLMNDFMRIFTIRF